MIYNYTASGNVSIDDFSESSSSYYFFEPDGTISPSGSSISIVKISFVGSGNIAVFGNAIGILNINCVGDGGISLSYTTYANPTVSVFFNFDFNFDIYKQFEFSQTFNFNVGELPLRTFRVVGVEYYNCDNIPFCAIPNGLNRMFQEIIARDLEEVCQFLTDVNWTWPIADIQRSIHPVNSFVAIGSTGIAINGLPVPSSNEFVSVPFSKIPECIPFTVVATTVVSMGIKTGIIELSYYEASGGITINSQANLERKYVSSGNILTYGSSEVLCAFYIYVGDGNVYIDDSALISLSNYTYESLGSIIVEGESLPVSPYYKYNSSGGITTSNESLVEFKLSFVSTGLGYIYPSYAGVVVYGSADYPIKPYVDGLMYVYGNSIYSRNIYIFESLGTVSIGGSSKAISPYQSYEGDGTVILNGSIDIGVASFEIPVDDSVPITLGDAASTRDSIAGDFWYTSLLSPISFGGDSKYVVPGYTFDSNGSIYLSGTYDSSLNVDDVSMGVITEIDFLEIAYAKDFVTDLIPITQNITTTCGNCDAIPEILYMRTNLGSANVLQDFLLRNNLKIPESLQLFYNTITNSWQHSLHLRGIGSDNSNTQELWHINFDWSCISQYGEDVLSSSMWKFGLYAKRINLQTGSDTDARLFVLFPSEDLCNKFKSFGIDFTFDFHFRPDYVTNDLKISVDTLSYYDELNIFKGTYWDVNNFVCRILDKDIRLDTNVIDISSLRPEPQSQFYV